MLLNAFRKFFNLSPNRKARRASGSPRLELLGLEERITPANFSSDAAGLITVQLAAGESLTAISASVATATNAVVTINVTSSTAANTLTVPVTGTSGLVLTDGGAGAKSVITYTAANNTAGAGLFTGITILGVADSKVSETVAISGVNLLTSNPATASSFNVGTSVESLNVNGSITAKGGTSTTGAVTLDATAVNINGAGIINTTAGNVTITGTTITTVAAITTTTGNILHTGATTLTGFSTLRTTGGNIAFVGTISGGSTLVLQTTGVVEINNSSASTTNISISAGTLTGTGSIGNLTGSGKGIIAPGIFASGTSPGKFTTTSLSLSSGNTLQMELTGSSSTPVAGTDYDQIVVSSGGTVALGSANLSLSTTFAGSAGTVFTIIDNQGTSAVTGIFSGLIEGAIFTANGKDYQISYVGGTGNDVTLTVIADTVAPTIVITSDKSALKSGETATITFTLSESSTDFDDADIVEVGGTLGTLSGTGTVYTATFTPDISSITTATFNIAAGTFTDSAGNSNIAATQLSVTVDTAVPNAPVISTVTDDISPITGTVVSGGTTNDTMLVLAGTAEANSTVTIFNGITSLGTATANGSGAWTFTTATLTDGSTYLFNATATDAAGNVSTASANYTVTVDNRVGVTLVPYEASFIDGTVSPGSGKTNLASLSYLATFDSIVDNFPRSSLMASGLLVTSVFRIADKTGLHWKIDAKPTNALGALGATTIQVVASQFIDVNGAANSASNIVAVDVLRNKLTSVLSAGANAARVIGRVTTLSGLSVVFSGPVDPTTVVASAFNTYSTGVISNIVVAANRLSATFDLNINNGGTAFNGSVRFRLIDKAIQDEYGNKVKYSSNLNWTYDGIGATAVFASSAAARVRAGQQIQWTVKFSEAVAFSNSNLTVTIGGVTVNSSQITLRGSGSSYTVTLKTTTALKGALVVAMKSGSAGPLDLRGNQMAVIPSDLAKTTII